MSPQERAIEMCKHLPNVHPWNVEEVIDGLEKQGLKLREEQKLEIMQNAIDKIQNWAIAV